MAYQNRLDQKEFDSFIIHNILFFILQEHYIRSCLKAADQLP